MKSILVKLFILLSFTYFASCKLQKHKAINQLEGTEGNLLVSNNLAGTYHGILPCPDCEGVKTILTLNADLSYSIKKKYIGQSEIVYETKGTFSHDEKSNKIILENNDGQTYLADQNKLILLDKKGNPMKENLSDNFILVKEKVEIKEKYWRLVWINGKTVETRKEPYIKLLSENNRVTGNSSCNALNGNYELANDNRIKFTQLGMTKMACIDNHVEPEMMQALEKTTNFKLSENELIFFDDFEKPLAKFESDYFR